MRRRRRFLGGIVAILAAPVVRAQPPRVLRVIGLSNSTPAAAAAYIKALEDGFRELGYSPGRNIGIEHLYAEGNPERLPALAAEIVRRKPDVIIAASNAETAAAKAATDSIPIVMGLGAGPVEAGLIATLSRPGANVTGNATGASAQILGKWFELLREAKPGLKRAGVLWDPGVPGFNPFVSSLEEAARRFGIALRWVEVRRAEELDAALMRVAGERVEALCVIANVLTFTFRHRIAAFVAEQRLPAISYNSEFAEAGLLMSHGADLLQLYKRSAVYADKILKGSRPADLPVEQPNKYETVINLKAAKSLGLALPPSLLLRADRTIE
jgi:putative ABC transport system substrate-binding protein